MIYTIETTSQFRSRQDSHSKMCYWIAPCTIAPWEKWIDMGVTTKHARATRGRRGQIMVILALAAVALVGVAALGIDVFYIYWNKNRLQSGTDAAALAGATYFSGVTFTGNGLCLYPSAAQNAACTYALNNGVLMTELTSVVANASAESMTVSATRTVSALFAKVVGIQNFTVSATPWRSCRDFRPPAASPRLASIRPLPTRSGRQSLCTMGIAAPAAGMD
jgi:hypothetical protein